MTRCGIAPRRPGWTAIRFAALVVVLTSILTGCGGSPDDKNIIARVGDARLTMADAVRAIDTTQGPIARQLPAYITSWVTDELLYQEAQRAGMEDGERYRRQLDDARRQLAIQALLQQAVYDDTGGVDDAALRTYFNEHATEFFVPEDMVRLNIAGFTTRELASEFAAGLGPDVSWSAAVGKVAGASASQIIALPSDQYFSRQTLFPPELWKVASTLNINEVSFPIKTNLGYFVIQLLAVIPKGQPAGLDVVRDEVHSRLLIERRRKKYADYLGTLRKRYDVEVLLNSVNLDDSTQNQHHE